MCEREENLFSMQRILIVCADPHLTTMLRLTLSDEGYDTTTALTSVTALEILKTVPGPFIIIIDGIHSNAENMQLLHAFPKRKKTRMHYPIVILNGGSGPMPPALQKIIERFTIPIVRVPFDVDVFLRLLRQISTQNVPPH